MKAEGEISEVIIDKSKIQPIIVKFQNGVITKEEANKMKVGLFRDPNKDNQTLLAMSNGKMVYKGYRPDPDQEMTYTMLAIRNKVTHKVRLVNAERWLLGPVLDKEPESNDVLDTNKINTLNKQFGSKKARRRTEQYEKMKVDDDTAKEYLEKSIANVESTEAELSVLNVEDPLEESLPPCNRDATVVQEVYSVYDILPKDKLLILAAKHEEICQLERTNPFYIGTLTNLMSLKADSKRNKKIAILEFIYSMCEWLNSPTKTPKKKLEKICQVSPEISTFIIETYSVMSETGRIRPISVRDKAVIHCMILALLISEFTLDLEIFSSMLNGRTGLKKLRDFARIIGATPMKDKKLRVVLKLPLPSQQSLVRHAKPNKRK